MKTRAGGYRRHSKTRDRALTLVLVGLVLLMPPVAAIFHVNSKLFQIPATLIYLFAVWALLIIGAALLSRPLREGDETEDRAP